MKKTNKQKQKADEPQPSNYAEEPQPSNYAEEPQPPLYRNYAEEPQLSNYAEEPQSSNYAEEPQPSNYGYIFIVCFLFRNIFGKLWGQSVLKVIFGKFKKQMLSLVDSNSELK